MENIKKENSEEPINFDEVKMVECSQCSVSVISFMLDEHLKTCAGADDEDNTYEFLEEEEELEHVSEEAENVDEIIEEIHQEKFECDVCDVKCDSERVLKEHIKKEHSDDETEINNKCNKCGKQFKRKYQLDRHMRCLCNKADSDKYPCNVCQKTFTRKDYLRSHLKAHMVSVKKEKDLKCEICSKEFSSNATLVLHKRSHTGERPFKCDLCPKSFPSSGAMKKHRRKHTGEKPYSCKQCEARFAAKETLNRHIRTHTGEKPHECTICGRRFIQATQLRAHMFHHTGENAYNCEYPGCAATFNRRLRLTTHVRYVHEGAEPLQCDQCPKTFTRKEELQRHGLLHSGVKNFVCETCDKKFATKASLKTHWLTHRREEPRSCHECGRAFIRLDCLIRHMRSKHRDALADIISSVERRRLQEKLMGAAADASENSATPVPTWSEEQLLNAVKELLSLLVDEDMIKVLGGDKIPTDKLLENVVLRCGHRPGDDIRDNTILLFKIMMDEHVVETLLNNRTIDEVIQHVLDFAKSS